MRQIIISFLILTLSSCTSKKNFRSSADKIKYYESRARTYRVLSSSQILSIPHGKNSHHDISGFFDPSMKMIYLQEAKRYEKLAKGLKADQKKRRVN